MQALIKTIKKGWPQQKNDLCQDLRPYWQYKDELTFHYGIVWRGERVLIPKRLQLTMLKHIHIGHLGLEKCKLRAREIMFWPNMNAQLADYLTNCDACMTHKKQNTKEPLMPHDTPIRSR